MSPSSSLGGTIVAIATSISFFVAGIIFGYAVWRAPRAAEPATAPAVRAPAPDDAMISGWRAAQIEAIRSAARREWRHEYDAQEADLHRQGWPSSDVPEVPR